MYKEFRELTRADAVEALYQDMAARHRARFGSIHVSSPHQDKLYVDVADNRTDHSRRRDRRQGEDPSSLHPTTRHQGPQVPSASPRRQATREEGLRLLAAFYFCLNACGFSGTGKAVNDLFLNKDSQRKEQFLATSSFQSSLTVYQWDRASTNGSPRPLIA